MWPTPLRHRRNTTELTVGSATRNRGGAFCRNGHCAILRIAGGRFISAGDGPDGALTSEGLYHDETGGSDTHYTAGTGLLGSLHPQNYQQKKRS